jgi:hypothetical protein
VLLPWAALNSRCYVRTVAVWPAVRQNGIDEPDAPIADRDRTP